jgi:hypothetical protein
MLIFLNEYRFVPPLKNVSYARMSAVEALRVYSVQLLHSRTEVWIRRFDADVIVVIHQAIRVTQPIVFIVVKRKKAGHIEYVVRCAL